MQSIAPIKVPEKGFYYHYKHDPSIGLNHYAYEILGLTRHTEDKTYLVRYRPLYQGTYLGEAQDSVRPLSMWFDIVDKDGKTFPRFQKITDPVVIAELEKIKMEMYAD